MGNINYNSLKVPIEGTSIYDGRFYCVRLDDGSSEAFCAKAWQASGEAIGKASGKGSGKGANKGKGGGGGPGYYAAAAIADWDGDSINTFKVFKGNGAEVTERILAAGEVFVVSQVGPITTFPWAVTDKSSIAGALFDDQVMFLDSLLYYFEDGDEGGSVTVAFSGSAGLTDLFPNQEITPLTLTNQILIV